MWVYLYWAQHWNKYNGECITKLYSNDYFEWWKLKKRDCEMCNRKLNWDEAEEHLWVSHEILNPDFEDDTRVWLLIKEYLKTHPNHWIFLN